HIQIIQQAFRFIGFIDGFGGHEQVLVFAQARSRRNAFAHNHIFFQTCSIISFLNEWERMNNYE
ncbi:MAG: hypothetical protein RL329_3835, partial [Bacteroidota bacterium]